MASKYSAEDSQSDDIFSVADKLVKPERPLHDDKSAKCEEIIAGG